MNPRGTVKKEPPRTHRRVRASDLAQMGICERRIVLAARHGERHSDEQQVAAARGTVEHGRFMRAAQAANPRVDTSETRGRCFIATAAFGDGAETVALRAFRDEVLRRSAAGRLLIAIYYRVSPPLAAYLEQRPFARAVARVLLRPFVEVAERLPHKK